MEATTDAETKDQGLRIAHGRGFNVKIPGYQLPADQEEHARLDRQSYIIKSFIGGSYLPTDLVRQVLRPHEPPSARLEILDVGTGSGAWAIDMAKDFPEVDVIGMDIARPKVLDRPHAVPPNCRLEIADANDENNQYTNRFSLVHVRCAEQGIHDFDGLLYTAARWLKPGGVILLVNTVCILMKEDGKTPFPLVEEDHPEFNWFTKIWSTIWDAIDHKACRGLNTMYYWGKWLAENPNYRNVRVESKFMPVGKLDGNASREQKRVNEMMRSNICAAFQALKPVLIKHFDGDKEAAEDIVERASKEMESPQFRGSIRWQFISAVRGDTEWIPRSRPKDLAGLYFNPIRDWSKVSGVW